MIKMKQYTIKCAYCGATTKKMEWLLKLHFILHTTYTLNCPVCHKKTVWITHFLLKHDTLNNHEQTYNKSKLFDDRI